MFCGNFKTHSYVALFGCFLSLLFIDFWIHEFAFGCLTECK